jgi:hypothetical protein
MRKSWPLIWRPPGALLTTENTESTEEAMSSDKEDERQAAGFFAYPSSLCVLCALCGEHFFI